jgi:hypothetical protein
MPIARSGDGRHRRPGRLVGLDRLKQFVLAHPASDAFPLAFGLAAFSRRNFAEFLMQRSLPFETFRIGARMIVHLGEGASEVKTVFDNDVGLSIGESAIIVPDAEAVCAFDAASGRAIGAM